MKAFNLSSLPYVGKRYTVNAVSLGSKRHGGELNLISAPKGLVTGEQVTLSTSSTGRPKILRGIDDIHSSSWLAKLSSKNKSAYGVGSIYIPKDDIESVEIIATGVGFYAPSKLQGFIDALVKVTASPSYAIPIFVSSDIIMPVYVFSNIEVVHMNSETLYGLTDMCSPFECPDEYVKLSIRGTDD